MEDNVLMEFILESAHHGFPMENPEIKMTANMILMARIVNWWENHGCITSGTDTQRSSRHSGVPCSIANMLHL
jgi:hypothetical protein